MGKLLALPLLAAPKYKKNQLLAFLQQDSFELFVICIAQKRLNEPNLLSPDAFLDLKMCKNAFATGVRSVPDPVGSIYQTPDFYS